MRTTLGLYTILDDLSVGGNASVYRATNGSDVVVLKEVKNTKSLGQRELSIHDSVERCNPSNVVRLVRERSWTEQSWRIIVQENFTHDLRGLQPDLCPVTLLNCALHTVRGMLELEKAGWIHDDLKPENFVVKREGGSLRSAICDLGGCRRIGHAPIENTTDYAAPELLRGQGSNTTCVYSWGLTMEELCCRRVGISRAGVSLDSLVPWIGGDFSEIIKMCTRESPSDRPSLTSLLKRVQECARLAQQNCCKDCGSIVMPSSNVLGVSKCPNCVSSF